MLIRCIRAERMKLRHSRMWLILMLLPVISLLIGCANYAANQAILDKGWYSLWTQASLFYGQFFLPVLIAILCAFMWRLEHVNKNWNAVMTAPVGAAHLFFAKLIMTSVLTFSVQAFFGLLYYIAGVAMGLSLQMPVEIIGWIAGGWVASITVNAVQLLLSMRIRSFAVPIGISVCAVFAGLGLYVAKAGMLFPYSLLTIGMSALSQESLSPAQMQQFFIMNLFFIVLVSGLAIHRLRSVDVVA